MLKKKDTLLDKLPKTPKIVTDSIDKVANRAEKLKDEISKRAEDAAGQTQRRATKLMLSVVDFQKTTFDNSFKAISQLQEQSERVLQRLSDEAGWLPKEAKSIVHEWMRMMRAGRVDFKKTVDKSFDLVTDYFDRVAKADAAAPKKAAKKAPAKKAAPKKAAKKAPAKKGAKKPTAKKA